MAVEAHVPRGNRNPLPHDLKLSKRAREVLVVAEREADALGHQDLTNEHILLGLVTSGNSFAAELLTKGGFSADQLRRRLESSSR